MFDLPQRQQGSDSEFNYHGRPLLPLKLPQSPVTLLCLAFFPSPILSKAPQADAQVGANVLDAPL
jgi:hypothetical protein